MNSPSQEPSATTDPRNLLYVSDMDGTLLDGNGQLPEDSVRRLNRLIDKGLNFTVATARNYDSAYPLLRGLNLRHPIILFNGVYLTELHTGANIFFSDFISAEIIKTMMAIVEPRGIDPFIYTYGERHRVYFRSASNPGAQAYVDSMTDDDRMQKVEEFIFSQSERISGFLLIDTGVALEPVYNELRSLYIDDLNIYFAKDISNTGFHWLQSFHQEANKGKMLKRMTQHLGISLSETVVFGDYLNDIDMFKIAGHAIAVENALPEVKSVAQQVIASNVDQGVIAYLESLFDRKLV
ncbi:MAG: HAD family hydrolase [Nitrospinaceae bacterium]|jgi:Cof subfamily protein (haloacid dehalogenase superfamily)|nr:HAD family hydrolase [Nitrospinaceae bacterium]